MKNSGENFEYYLTCADDDYHKSIVGKVATGHSCRIILIGLRISIDFISLLFNSFCSSSSSSSSSSSKMTYCIILCSIYYIVRKHMPSSFHHLFLNIDLTGIHI